MVHMRRNEVQRTVKEERKEDRRRPHAERRGSANKGRWTGGAACATRCGSMQKVRQTISKGWQAQARSHKGGGQAAVQNVIKQTRRSDVRGNQQTTLCKQLQRPYKPASGWN